MSVSRALRATLLFVLLTALHFSVRPLLPERLAVDFLVIALLLAAVRLRPGWAAVAGFALGLLVDSLAPGTFGAAALAMTTVGFSASWLKAVFFADNLALNGFFIFMGKWAFDLLYLAAGRRVPGGEWLMQAMVWSPLAAAATALAGVLLLLVLRPLLEARAT
ncbi:MAG TPA: rod shape-determining protein MreD [Gemmatimonadaceae bacterium]|jgi:rod shape-determining protein MreD|nr:rod shape-determining protein MreD [Gemmatimonadaceae bacterium]